MNDRVRIALIYGSTREGRFCDTVATWAGQGIRERGEFTLDMIDPSTLVLPARHGSERTPDLADLHRRIDGADAFVVVTPEYNHSFPAPLKHVIDLANREWRAKPVAFVSYGGISGGLRAIEQLRLVFAELHAVGIRDTVSLANPWDRFDFTGALPPTDPAHAAMASMLDHLRWWGLALRKARREMPYERLAA